MAFSEIQHCPNISQVNLQAASLRRNARVLDELDVTLAFAQLAIDMNLVRPSIQDE